MEQIVMALCVIGIVGASLWVVASMYRSRGRQRALALALDHTLRKHEGRTTALAQREREPDLSTTLRGRSLRLRLEPDEERLMLRVDIPLQSPSPLRLALVHRSGVPSCALAWQQLQLQLDPEAFARWLALDTLDPLATGPRALLMAQLQGAASPSPLAPLSVAFAADRQPVQLAVEAGQLTAMVHVDAHAMLRGAELNPLSGAELMTWLDRLVRCALRLDEMTREGASGWLAALLGLPSLSEAQLISLLQGAEGIHAWGPSSLDALEALAPTLVESSPSAPRLSASVHALRILHTYQRPWPTLSPAQLTRLTLVAQSPTLTPWREQARSPLILALGQLLAALSEDEIKAQPSTDEGVMLLWILHRAAHEPPEWMARMLARLFARPRVALAIHALPMCVEPSWRQALAPLLAKALWSVEAAERLIALMRDRALIEPELLITLIPQALTACERSQISPLLSAIPPELIGPPLILALRDAESTQRELRLEIAIELERAILALLAQHAQHQVGGLTLSDAQGGQLTVAGERGALSAASADVNPEP